ncbi:25838_t:CDS:2, partial [Gigaspora rosea]
DPMVFNLEKSREKEDFDEYIRLTKFREKYHFENEYSSSSEESQSYQKPEQYESSSESDEYETIQKRLRQCSEATAKPIRSIL